MLDCYLAHQRTQRCMELRRFFSRLFGQRSQSPALLLFCASYSEAAEAEVAAYEWPTAGWRVSTPEELGMDSAALADLVISARATD
jgi:hypothetical protein